MYPGFRLACFFLLLIFKLRRTIQIIFRKTVLLRAKDKLVLSIVLFIVRLGHAAANYFPVGCERNMKMHMLVGAYYTLERVVYGPNVDVLQRYFVSAVVFGNKGRVKPVQSITRIF